MTESIWLWFGFNVFVLATHALGRGVFQRKAHEREAFFLAGQSQLRR